MRTGLLEELQFRLRLHQAHPVDGSFHLVHDFGIPVLVPDFFHPAPLHLFNLLACLQRDPRFALRLLCHVDISLRNYLRLRRRTLVRGRSFCNLLQRMKLESPGSLTAFLCLQTLLHIILLGHSQNKLLRKFMFHSDLQRMLVPIWLQRLLLQDAGHLCLDGVASVHLFHHLYLEERLDVGLLYAHITLAAIADLRQLHLDVSLLPSPYLKPVMDVVELAPQHAAPASFLQQRALHPFLLVSLFSESSLPNVSRCLQSDVLLLKRWQLLQDVAMTFFELLSLTTLATNLRLQEAEATALLFLELFVDAVDLFLGLNEPFLCARALLTISVDLLAAQVLAFLGGAKLWAQDCGALLLLRKVVDDLLELMFFAMDMAMESCKLRF
mmetsp:Transcript_38798/g.106876  ORF Transcript_38798/g.106876 Transcript_38798/m.106876 type:complete len:383 (-) Transcript_38798:222-1370(-)